MIPTSMLSELTLRRMLALTKAVLHGTIPDESLFVNAEETDWNELIEQSAVQGIRVLSWNGAMRLPKELQPPLPVKLRWIANVEAVEKQYRHCLETAEKLASYFRENNIRMLLFKGIALSRLYPVPGSREFGDIDIFLCGKAKEGDILLERIADKKFLSVDKHTDFSYREVLIENHHTFLNQSGGESFSHCKFLEKQLMMLLVEAGIQNETYLAETGQTDETLLFPPPEFDALFVTLHMLGHLPGRIKLRYLCDLTVLFTAYKGKIDFSFYRNALSEAGLLKPADALISLAVRYFGLNPEYAPLYKSDLSLEDRIWDDLLNPIPPISKEKRTLFNVLIYKIRSLQARYWKNKLVFPGKFTGRILSAIFFYFRHPGKIGKLRE